MSTDNDEEEVFLAQLYADFQFFIEWALYVSNGNSAEFFENWHIDAMAWALTRCATGEIKRLLITVPPRYFKSHCASVAFPAWVLGRNPSAKFMCVSYGAKPAEEFAKGTRNLMTTPEFEWAFPETKLVEGPLEMLRTSAGGQRMATSVSGVATGFGADYLIIDDMTKASASAAERAQAINYFETTLLSRLNDKKNGVVIVVAQRTHIDDLPGHLLDQGGWYHLNLPAIAPKETAIEIGTGMVHFRKKGDVLHPEREDRATLDKIRQDIGDATFDAQYLQAPGAPQGAAFRSEWFRRFDLETAPPWPDHRIFVIDCAYSAATGSDYSVCSVFDVRHQKAYLLHVWRDRVDYDDLIAKIDKLIDQYKPSNVFIENSALGVPLLQRLEKKFVWGIFPVLTRNRSKQDRAAAASNMLRSGRIFFPKSALWLECWENEIFSYPSVKHDDQVDTLVYFALMMEQGFNSSHSIEWHRRPPPGRLFNY